MRDSQSFSHNISTSGSQTPDKKGPAQTSSSKPATGDDGKEEVSPEDVSRILNEAAQELEQDAQKALRDLEEDKEIMKRLQEVKQRRKESSSDINKGKTKYSKVPTNKTTNGTSTCRKVVLIVNRSP